MTAPGIRVERIRSIVLTALMAAALVAVARRCLIAGMDWHLSARYWFYAFPSYFSEVTYGAQRYTYFRELAAHFASANPFETPSTFQPLLDAARGHAVAVGAFPPRYFPADEKGTVDFVRFAFAVFGTHVHSIFYLYLAILCLSAVLFVLRFRRDPASLLVGVAAATAFYVGIGAFLATKEVYSVTNPRAIGSLAIFALAHLMLLVLARSRPTRRDIPGLLIQSSILVFVITMRTSESWQVIALLIVATAMTMATFRDSHIRWAPALIVAPLLAGLAGYQIYQRLEYPPEYRMRNLENKIFWHNVLIGFALDPVLASTRHLALNDTSAMDFVKARVVAARRNDFEDIFWTSGSDGSIVKNFRVYDALCRQAVWSIAREQPWRVVELFLWYKPRQVLRTLDYVSGLSGRHDLKYYGIEDQRISLLSPAERSRSGAFYRPFTPLTLLLLGCGALAAGTGALRQALRGENMAALAVVTAASLVPAIATYPLIHVLPAFYVSLALLLFAGAGWAVFAVAARTERMKAGSSPGAI